MEIVALLATDPPHTQAEAAAIAAGNHFNREQAVLRALVRTRLDRNARGKHAIDGVTDIEDFTDDKGVTVTVAQVKARAAKARDAMDAEDAARGGTLNPSGATE